MPTYPTKNHGTSTRSSRPRKRSFHGNQYAKSESSKRNESEGSIVAKKNSVGTSDSVNVKMAKKSAILLLADGAEEMEAVVTVDILRRAEIDVTIASITEKQSVECSRGINILADSRLIDATKDQKYDAVILPGGLGGSKALAASKEVGALLKIQEKENRVIAAICAAPTALKAHGIANGKQITSYPSMKDKLIQNYQYINQKVVVDGNLITSQGPATAYDFGLAIVEKLVNKEVALRVAQGLLYDNYK